MFESNNDEATAAWAMATRRGVLTGSERDLVTQYYFTVEVRVTADGRLVTLRTGTGEDLTGTGRPPNQFDRNPEGTFSLEPRYCFATQAEIDEWHSKYSS